LSPAFLVYPTVLRKLAFFITQIRDTFTSRPHSGLGALQAESVRSHDRASPELGDKRLRHAHLLLLLTSGVRGFCKLPFQRSQKNNQQQRIRAQQSKIKRIAADHFARRSHRRCIRHQKPAQKNTRTVGDEMNEHCRQQRTGAIINPAHKKPKRQRGKKLPGIEVHNTKHHCRPDDRLVRRIVFQQAVKDDAAKQQLLKDGRKVRHGDQVNDGIDEEIDAPGRQSDDRQRAGFGRSKIELKTGVPFVVSSSRPARQPRETAEYT